jgi:uncharacterized protein YdaT
MPGQRKRYPPAMRRLEFLVRLKAIEIADAMLEEGAEGQCIGIGIAEARERALRHQAELPMSAQRGL